jgi:hypothetical protein
LDLIICVFSYWNILAIALVHVAYACDAEADAIASNARTSAAEETFHNAAWPQ